MPEAPLEDTSSSLAPAGDGPCAILTAGARLAEERLHYPISELAAR